MAFILRQRSETLREDEARLQEADEVVTHFDHELRRLSGSGSGADVTPERLARLKLSASRCRADLEEARWRFLKGDTLAAERRLAYAVARAREGIRALDR